MSKQNRLDTRRLNALEASQKTFADIYKIMFSEPDWALCEGNDGFRTYRYTYGQMDARCRKAAAALYAKVGAAGAYIGLDMDNCPEWIVAFWGILMSGNKPYLVNLRYPQHLTEGILKTLEIRHIVCLESTKLPGTAIPMCQLEEDYPAVPEAVFADEFALSTSATTMKETICFYTGLQVSTQIMKFRNFMNSNSTVAKNGKNGINALAFLPFYHIYGLFATYFWYSFFKGRTIVFLRDYAADTILKTCRRHGVTHINAVPVLWHTVEKQLWTTVRQQGPKKEKQLRDMLKFTTSLQNICPTFGSWLAKRLLKQVTGQLFGTTLLCCINGGSYLRNSAMALFNSLGYTMMNGFGMSELGITSVDLRRRPKDLNKNSVGRPFTGLEYRIREDGVLLVKGDTLCTRKLVNGQAILTPEWFETGDIMDMDADGYYYIRGRKGDVVIGENGENINPDTVEQLFVLDGSRMLSVLGMPGENGEELCLVVQLNPFATEETVAKIRDQAYAVNATLPKTSAVRRFYCTFDDLAPPTAIKVGRYQLRRKIESGDVRLTAFADFRTEHGAVDGDSPVLHQIKQIIAEHLELAPDKVDTNAHIFYDLGATSIQYFSILSAIMDFVHITDYNKGEGYRYTPREICEYIERHL